MVMPRKSEEEKKKTAQRYWKKWYAANREKKIEYAKEYQKRRKAEAKRS